MALEQFRLDGQVAIVTGAGRGVGAGIARVLAEAGATIVGTARTESEIVRSIEGIEEAVQAIGRVPALSRARCRQVFEQRFLVSRMAQDYLRIYKKLLGGRSARAAA